MRGRYAANPYYVECETQLMELSQLMAQGMGDTEEADALREAMDQAVQELTRGEIERLNGLSADLYMLENDEVYEPLEPEEDPAERTPERLRSLLAQAWAGNNAATALSLLRKGSADLAQDQRAYLRARAYEELGHLDTALVFMRYAAEQNVDYGTGVLYLLERLGRLDELYAQAQTYLSQEGSSPELLVQSAGVLFGSTRGMSPEQAQPTLEAIVRTLESILPHLEDKSRLMLPDLSGYGHLTLGLSYKMLGRSDEAEQAFGKAMDSDRTRDAARVARGILLAETKPAEAVADFEAAVTNNTPLVAPYLQLAYHALTQGEFERCLVLSAQGLDRTRNPRLQAVLLQWQAIAGLELGLPEVQVQRAFEVARALDPLNPQIQHNVEVFRQRTGPNANVLPSPSAWETPSVPIQDTADLVRSSLSLAA